MERNLRKRTNKIMVIEDSDSEDDNKSHEFDTSWQPEVTNNEQVPERRKRLMKPSKTIKEDVKKTKTVRATKRSNETPSTFSPPKVRKVESDIICISDTDSEKLLKKPKKKVSTAKKTTRVTKEKKTSTSKKAKQEEVNNNAQSSESHTKATIKGRNSFDLEKQQILQQQVPEGVREWVLEEFISEETNVPQNIVKNILRLFNDDHTIPFIARYRKGITQGLEADKLREIKLTANRAKEIKDRANTILKAADNLGCWTPDLYRAVKSIKSLDTLEEIYNLYKPPPKKSILRSAQETGLQSVADQILNGVPINNLSSYINPADSMLENIQSVMGTIKILLIDAICKNQQVLEKLDEYQNFIRVTTEKKISKSKNVDKKFKSTESQKYERYWNFRECVTRIKPYQVLAINRGVKNGYLSVKFQLDGYKKNEFKQYCIYQYRNAMRTSAVHNNLLNEAIDQFFESNLQSRIDCRVRRLLDTEAEKAALAAFSTNFKQLLLTPPVRGKVVLGIDPGFTNGCKLAVVSAQGAVLDEGYVYLKSNEASSMKVEQTLIELIVKYQCTLIALGNGTGCREMERLVSRLIKERLNSLDYKISYCIVNEAGVSAYSVSDVARAEFPGKDVNLISAISIARRMQDLLAEAVKVDPECLGVGMYQKDLPEKQLKMAMNEVVTEVVSFLGVDVNTASDYLLMKVSGIGPVKAKNIIEYRNEHKTIRSRREVLKITGIGPKTYQQCAGFLRIIPETAGSSNGPTKSNSVRQLNLLDQTWIHPESYDIANKILSYFDCKMLDYGTPEFVKRIKEKAAEGHEALAQKFNTDGATIELIIKALSMAKNEDIRGTSEPLYRRDLTSIKDIKVGSSLTGAVRNVTQFGTFVDIGVGTDALIPLKYLRGETLHVNQRIQVIVKELRLKADRPDLHKDMITLELESVL